MAEGVIDPAAQVPKKNRWQALLFVLVAFGCWFLFAYLARIVMKCAPTFELWPPVQCVPMDLASLKQLSWSDTTMLIATLGIGIWAGWRVVFPPDD